MSLKSSFRVALFPSHSKEWEGSEDRMQSCSESSKLQIYWNMGLKWPECKANKHLESSLDQTFAIAREWFKGD